MTSQTVRKETQYFGCRLLHLSGLAKLSHVTTSRTLGDGYVQICPHTSPCYAIHINYYWPSLNRLSADPVNPIFKVSSEVVDLNTEL